MVDIKDMAKRQQLDNVIISIIRKMKEAKQEQKRTENKNMTKGQRLDNMMLSIIRKMKEAKQVQKRAEKEAKDAGAKQGSVQPAAK